MHHPTPEEVVDFQRQVIELSYELPVLVDFWAPWCGPCRTLGPLLDRLAEEAIGSWQLVKVNSDLHPELMSKYGVRGIPAVKLFVEGSVKAEFTGALPEFTLRKWLEEHVPSQEKAQLETARRLFAEDRRDEALAMAEALLDTPVRNEAATLVARLIVLHDPERAVELVREEFGSIAEAVRTVAAFITRPDGEFPEASVKLDYIAARRELKGGNVDSALGHLIYVLREDRAYHDDGARRVCVALFAVLGEHQPDVKKHRSDFNSSLY